MNKFLSIGNALIITGAALLLASGVWYLYNSAEDLKAEEASARLADQVKVELSATAPSTSSALFEDEAAAAGILGSEADGSNSLMVFDDEQVDGLLSIPAIELEMAVIDNWSEQNLKRSICRYYGSSSTNDLVIAGHNYKSGFGKLKHLSVGDSVYFTDMSGNVQAYEVAVIEVISGTDVPSMIKDGWDLSLFTCTYGGVDRLTVRCRLKA